MNSAITSSRAPQFYWMGLIAVVASIFSLGWIVYGIPYSNFLGPYGTEFSPYSFNSREFQTNVWFRRTVVQPASLACPTEISKHLTNSTRTSGIERWDLIRYSNGFWGMKDSEASIILDCFGTLDGQDNLLWEKWSKDQPDLAKILWPSVQQLAIHHSYFAIPELLQLALACPTPIDFQEAISRISMRAALDQAARQLAKNQFNDARMTGKWAKTFGESAELDALENSIRAGLASLSESKK